MPAMNYSPRIVSSQTTLRARLASKLPPWLTEILCAAATVAVVVALRRLIDNVIPGAAPFALLFPGVLLATSLAGWRAGLLTLIACDVLIWRYLLAPDGFSIAHRADVASLLLNAASGGLVIAVAEGFRWTSRRVIEERNSKLVERDLLFRELDHRVKNTFAVISSLIGLQRRRTADPNAQATLADLGRRVDSIARAHNDLYRSSDTIGTIDLGAYLGDLCRNLSRALFADGAVKLECSCESAPMERDRAIALGLVVNELVTNAAKHAFDDHADARISISLKRNGHGWRLVVADNGRGLPPDDQKSNGLGQGLIDGFVQQAKSVLTKTNGPGATFQIDVPG